MFISRKAPDFTAEAYMPDNTFGNIKLSQFKDKKYVVLFFYPLDFTFVCPSEIIDLSQNINEFKARNTQVIGISIDSKFSHYAWANTSIENGGIGRINIPLISDISKNISKEFQVLLNDSVALRATIIIDKEGIIRHYSLNDLPLGRNVNEIVRLIDSIQHTERFGEVCPSGWSKGKNAISPTSQSTIAYLKTQIK
jgi:peroxiredoxin (alkyl hydroperoxide reductase subunit C)